MRRIAVLGSGLAGVCATTALETQLEGRRHIELTHVSETTHFVYRPLLPHVISGALGTTALSVPLDDVFESSTDIVVERIRHIDPDRRVIAGKDRDIPFDYLIIAPPPIVDWGEHPEWHQKTHPFETLGDAADIRQSVADLRESEISAQPNGKESEGEQIVVIGAGSNGVELACELDRALEHTTPDDNLTPDVVLVDRADEPLPSRPKPFRDACRDALHDRGIRFLGGGEIVACREDGVELTDGTWIRADSRFESSVFWCGGIRPPGFLESDAFERDVRGRMQVDDYLSVRDCYGIYAAGPIASPPATAPSSADATVEQGRAAAGNLLADLSGRTPNPFDGGNPTWTVSLGPDAAAVYRNGTVVTGPAGWALYRVHHTSLIPGAVKKVGLLGAWLQEGIRRASD